MLESSEQRQTGEAGWLESFETELQETESGEPGGYHPAGISLYRQEPMDFIPKPREEASSRASLTWLPQLEYIFKPNMDVSCTRRQVARLCVICGYHNGPDELPFAAGSKKNVSYGRSTRTLSAATSRKGLGLL